MRPTNNFEFTNVNQFTIPVQYSVGDKVTIFGLQNRTVYNGLEVELLEWFAAKGRWKVKTDNPCIPMVKVKPTNLRMVNCFYGQLCFVVLGFWEQLYEKFKKTIYRYNQH